MSDEELLQRYLDYQNERRRSEFLLNMIHLICVGMFVFGALGFYIWLVIS